MKNIYELSRKLKTVNLSNEDILIINSVSFNISQKTLFIGYIIRYNDLNLSMALLYDNWPKISKLGRDSSSKESHILRYGKIEGTKKYDSKTKACTITHARMKEKLGKEGADAFYKARAGSEECFIARQSKVRIF
jgi:hypothetical protein